MNKIEKFLQKHRIVTQIIFLIITSISYIIFGFEFTVITLLVSLELDIVYLRIKK